MLATAAKASSARVDGGPVRARLREHRRPSRARAIAQLVNTLLPFLALWAATAYGLAHGQWPALLLTLPAALFLIRLFVIHHDCGHGSFFTSPWANGVTGFLLSLLTLTPYHSWRRSHALHHASACNLDRRGQGYFRVATVAEYRAMPPLRRRAYRVLHHPAFLFGVAPVPYFTVGQRLTIPSGWTAERRSACLGDLLVGLFAAGLVVLLGLRTVLLVEGPIVFLTSSIGMWLFYTQHVFEGATWRAEDTWDFSDAALRGSAHYELPPLLRWFTANIGLHHLHHLDSRIPNYRLRQCAHEHPELAAVRLTLRDAWGCARLALWDEQRARMVGFREAQAG